MAIRTESLLSVWEKQRRKGISHATLVARLKGDGDGDEPDDDDDTDEPKKPIERKAKGKSKSKKAKAKKAKAVEAPELVAARIERDVAKARATGAGSYTAGMSEPRNPRFEPRGGSHFAPAARPEEFILANAGFSHPAEAEAHGRVARAVRDRVQAAPGQRLTDGLPVTNLASVRDQARKNALGGNGAALPPGMFRAFRSERGSGPFDGGAAA
jgi:hypothetical protein